MDKIFNTIKSFLDKLGHQYDANEKELSFQLVSSSIAIQVYHTPCDFFTVTVFDINAPLQCADQLFEVVNRFNKEHIFSHCVIDFKKNELQCVTTFIVDPDTVNEEFVADAFNMGIKEAGRLGAEVIKACSPEKFKEFNDLLKGLNSVLETRPASEKETTPPDSSPSGLSQKSKNIWERITNPLKRKKKPDMPPQPVETLSESQTEKPQTDDATMSELLKRLVDTNLTMQQRKEVLLAINAQLSRDGKRLSEEYIDSFVLGKRGKEAVFEEMCLQNRLEPTPAFCRQFLSYDSPSIRERYYLHLINEKAAHIQTKPH